MDILQGTLDSMVLRTLTSRGRLHGYAIAARFEQVSEGSVLLNMGTLYPALVRMEQRGLIRGKWEITENDRPARLYEIAGAGRKELEKGKSGRLRMANFKSRMLNEEG